MKRVTTQSATDASAAPTGVPRTGLTEDQLRAREALERFLADRRVRVFVLRGYAGSGKTFLLASFAQDLDLAGRPVVPLAPTGRAARIFGRAAGRPAATIHSHIYDLSAVRYEIADDGSPLSLESVFRIAANEDPENAIYVVDEASMVSDRRGDPEHLRFGSGRLLADLIEFAGVRDIGHDRRLVFCGDPAQLPPVGDSASPALEPGYFSDTFGLPAHAAELTQVVRQREDSPVLALATTLRDNLRQGVFCDLDIVSHPPALDVLAAFPTAEWAAQFRTGGIGSSIVIADSNARALRYNQAIRAELFPGADGRPRPGEPLLVTANAIRGQIPLLNGDIVEVVEVSDRLETVQQPLFARRSDGAREVVPLAFRPIVIRAGEETIGVRILENFLESPNRDLTGKERLALFFHFLRRHPDLKRNSPDFLSRLFSDPWFNALRVKYGYAITGHKAQGGEWPRVAVDMETAWRPATAAWFRWAYTAVSRARERLVLIAPPRLSPEIIESRPSLETAVVYDNIRVDPIRPRESLRRDWLGAEPFPALAVMAFADLFAENGIRIEDVRHSAYLIRFSLRRDCRTATLDVHYNGRNRISRILAAPNSDTSLASDLLVKTAALQGRPFAPAPTETAPVLPAQPTPPPDSVPLPDGVPHPAICRFDAALRRRLPDIAAAVTGIEILNAYQIRYRFRNAAGDEAAILYFFNARGAATGAAVDGRRTTSAALAGKVLALNTSKDLPP